MRLLFIGDVVGAASVRKIASLLPSMIKEEKVDFVIANGENASENNGITKDIAEKLHFAGVDVITLGNHAFRQKSSYDFLDSCPYIIRPANGFPTDPGSGFTEIKTDFGKVGVINLSGKLYGDAVESPFLKAEKILENLKSDYIFVDFHAEATSEKRALGYFLDGKVTAVVGTHTHVPTADEQILPKGTGYITDVGMTGSENSVLGIEKQGAINKFLTNAAAKLLQEQNDIVIQSLLFDTETKEIRRIEKE